MGAQTCSLIECGCTPRSYAKTNHLFKRGIFCQFQCHRADHAVTSANGTLAFHRWWHHLNTVFTINTQRSLWTRETTTRLALPLLTISCAALRTSSGWVSSRFTSALSSFWLGLTNSMLPIASAALNASPELSTMQRIPCFAQRKSVGLIFPASHWRQASAYDEDGPGFNFQNLLFKLAKLIFI